MILKARWEVIALEEVRIWEEQVVFPTYEVGAADKNPMFLEKRVYQGSSGKIYPYPSTQEISREKKDKVWKKTLSSRSSMNFR